MLASIALALLTSISIPDTTFVLGRIEREITGDSVPEVLQLVAAGKTLDSLDVTLTIETSGTVLYRLNMVPITPRTFDPGRRPMPDSEYRARINSYGDWLFNDRNFYSPEEFVGRISRGRHAELIPHVIAKSRDRNDTRSAVDIWQDIRNSKVTVFWFSPGGDLMKALAWHADTRRFYNLIECC